VTWDGSQFVVASNGFLNRTNILRSPDGIRWHATYIGSTDAIESLRWTGSEFLGVGTFGTVLHSSDGAEWSVSARPTTSDLLALATNGSLQVAVGNKGHDSSERRRVSWDARAPRRPRRPLPRSPERCPIRRRGALAPLKRARLCSHGLRCQRSRPGSKEPSRRRPTEDVRGRGDAGTIVTSADGASWVARARAATVLTSILWDGNRSVSVGYDSVVVTSVNGVT
jgi:hypothetical protein